MDIPKIAAFLLFFALLALIVEIFYFRRKREGELGKEEQTVATLPNKLPPSRRRKLIVIGVILILLLLPASLYVAFQQVNLEKSAQTQPQTAPKLTCDRVDIIQGTKVVEPTQLRVSDRISLVGYCSLSGQGNINKLRFVLTTPDGSFAPKEYLAFKTAGSDSFKATYPNILLSKAGSYKVEVTAHTSDSAASQPFVRSFSVGSLLAPPTPTRILTPTPTQATTNKTPVCDSLSAIPLTGPVPLTVSFTGSGRDVGGQVVAFEFTFGDKAKQTVSKNVGAKGTTTTSHVYQTAGSYTATLRVQDNSGSTSADSSLCSVQISATSGQGGATGSANLKAQPTKAPTPTPTTPALPEAGISLPMVGFVGAGLLLLTLGLLLAL